MTRETENDANLNNQKNQQEAAIAAQAAVVARMRARRALDEFGEPKPDTPAIKREAEKLREMRSALEQFVAACQLL